ncbi:uncharacterized protein LOC127797415 [Diospyros lotus]|uniref:uncharacterized protein LOC127797415 n=1 Tax=Diospyros lotus TaxID=55363 RepID=UPI00225A6824|nr:uncharacterized protein LOC127797415 [Diospyros lotus]
MRERGKAVETYSASSNFSDYNYSAASEFPCKKHPSSSSVGICAYCLKDRLVKLVCSDCGEQRLSSCSCSEVSSYRNSSAAEIGSVGRMSFLIENERSDQTKQHHQHQQPSSKPRNGEGSEDFVLLKRSSSSCIAGVKRSGLWRIVRLFRKKREKGCERTSVGAMDDKCEMWVFDYMGGVSRSRSLCSFRGGSFHDPEDSSDFAFSSAKVSDVNGGPLFDSARVSGFSETEPRKSGFRAEKGGLLEPETGLYARDRTVFPVKESSDSARVSGFSESEPRKSGFKADPETAFYPRDRGVFPVKESDFSRMDESGFIDLKLDLSSESKPDVSVLKSTDHPVPVPEVGSLKSGSFLGNHESRGSNGSPMGDAMFRKGGSCRITVNERGIKRDKKGHKVWRWIFRHHPSGRSATKNDENNVLKS